MIRVHKPQAAPRPLATKGAAATKAMCAAHDANAADYRSGTRTFEFDEGLYSDAAVKDALKGAHHKKCAYCESQMMAVSFGDVEHYRPKGGVTKNGVLRRPGYFWLAYDWDNLLLACSRCNVEHKRNAFPLAKGSQRASPRRRSIAKEKPLFVHPAKEDPERVIGFREHMAYPIQDDERGVATIEGLGLNRPDLKEARERCLKHLQSLHRIVRLCPPGTVREDAEEQLREAVLDTAPFAAMARAFLRSAGVP